MRKVAGICATALALAIPLMMVAPAQAAPISSGSQATPMGLCNAMLVHKTITAKQNYYQAIGAIYHGINYTSYPNTVSFASSIAGTVQATLTGYAEGGINGAVASAKVGVSASISKAVTYTTSMTVTYTVPAHRTGYAQLGTSKWKVTTETWKESSMCSHITVGYGTLNAPTSIGWKTWNG